MVVIQFLIVETLTMPEDVLTVKASLVMQSLDSFSCVKDVDVAYHMMFFALIRLNIHTLL